MKRFRKFERFSAFGGLVLTAIASAIAGLTILAAALFNTRVFLSKLPEVALTIAVILAFNAAWYVIWRKAQRG